MSEKKICPLMSYRHPVTQTNFAYDRTNLWEPKECKEARCAWWDEDYEKCAIAVLARLVI